MHATSSASSADSDVDLDLGSSGPEMDLPETVGYRLRKWNTPPPACSGPRWSGASRPTGRCHNRVPEAAYGQE